MVPEDAYSSSYLREEPLDKSYHFISQCASQGYHVRWAGPGAGWAGPGWGRGLRHWGRGLTRCLTPAPAARPSSAVMRPPPCPSSTTTGLGLAAATKRAPRAPRARLSGASVPAVPTSLAETAPAAPPATGASPAAGVSAQSTGSPARRVAPEPGGWGFLLEGAHREAWAGGRTFWSLADRSSLPGCGTSGSLWPRLCTIPRKVPGVG